VSEAVGKTQAPRWKGIGTLEGAQVPEGRQWVLPSKASAAAAILARTPKEALAWTVSLVGIRRDFPGPRLPSFHPGVKWTARPAGRSLLFVSRVSPCSQRATAGTAGGFTLLDQLVQFGFGRRSQTGLLGLLLLRRGFVDEGFGPASPCCSRWSLSSTLCEEGEVRKRGLVVFLRDRIELVVVAAGALHGHAEERRVAVRVHAVGGRIPPGTPPGTMPPSVVM